MQNSKKEPKKETTAVLLITPLKQLPRVVVHQQARVRHAGAQRDGCSTFSETEYSPERRYRQDKHQGAPSSAPPPPCDDVAAHPLDLHNPDPLLTLLVTSAPRRLQQPAWRKHEPHACTANARSRKHALVLWSYPTTGKIFLRSITDLFQLIQLCFKL